ncbi:MAG: histidine phosphatase family protein [Patescibacteria group bacterium]
MVEIIFESHSTSLDNENHLSSGWNDIELSDLGNRQSVELGERYKNENFDAIFCSDLKRSYNTAEIAFANRDFKIIKDARLRECNYGDLTQHPSSEVDAEKPKRISEPFPNGESYEQAATRMGDFLKELLKDYDGKRVMIIGSRATQYGLEHWIKNVSVSDAVTASWKWQPGWSYVLDSILE